MLAKFTGAVPLLSAATLAVLGVFNLGYFWTIGLHFLGLVDLSNLVYSLGLAFSSVLFVGQLGFQLLSMADKPLTQARVRKIELRANIFYIIGGAMIVFSFVSQTLLLPGFVVAMLGFFGFVVGAIGGAAKAWLTSKAGKPQLPQDVTLLVFMAIGVVFGAGMVACQLELRDSATFRITTKQETIEGAHIIRSSSSGFIVVIDKTITFIPQSEVRELKSSVKLN